MSESSDIQAKPVESQLSIGSDGFDYDILGVTKKTQRSLEGRAKRITSHVDKVRRTTVESMFDIARELQAAHDELANHKNGTFGKWVRNRCGISQVSARRMLAAFRELAGNAYSTTVVEYFDTTACYLLTADSCPEEVTQEALELAKSGEQITAKKARQMIQEARGEEDTNEQVEVVRQGWNEDECALELNQWWHKWCKTISDASECERLKTMCAELSRDTDRFCDDWSCYGK